MEKRKKVKINVKTIITIWKIKILIKILILITIKNNINKNWPDSRPLYRLSGPTPMHTSY